MKPLKMFVNLRGSNNLSRGLNLQGFNFHSFDLGVLNLQVLRAGLALALIVCGIFSASGRAQGPIPDAPLPSHPAVSSFASISSVEMPNDHNFWDKQNLALFTTVAALNTADFFVTRSNLQSGGRELDPVVRVFGRSTFGLACNFAGETASFLGLSYFLHKTGHHKLERIASAVDIGGSASAVNYSLMHR